MRIAAILVVSLALSGCADLAQVEFHPVAPSYTIGPNPPVVMTTPRSCQSIVNGQFINTTCY
jgi:hypothetical protein